MLFVLLRYILNSSSFKLLISLIHLNHPRLTKGVAGLKAGLNLLGFKATKPRKATPELSSAEVKELREAFVEASIL